MKVTLTDPKLLHVMAHPLRMRIVGSLRIDGPATSSQLARRLDTDSGQTSHHLRQLAKHGFVEDAPELGKGPRGRERWWKAAHGSTEWSGSGDAVLAFERAARTVWEQAIDTFNAEVAQQTWSDDWQRVAHSSDYVIRTTPERLEWFQAQMLRLMQECETAEPGSANVMVVLHTYPRRTVR